MMKTVYSEKFKAYGKVVDGYAWDKLLTILATLPMPEEVVYVPAEKALERCRVFGELEDRFAGGMPIQIGYCNGHNRVCHAVEYHKSSELNIGATDFVLALGLETDIVDGRYDLGKAELLLCPAGTAVELYATTLHYAPIQTSLEGFRTAVVLPKGTNTPYTSAGDAGDDRLIFARNKWLLALPDSDEAAAGAWVGITGKLKELE